MPKIGQTRTRVSYVEATDIRDMLGLTGSVISGAIGAGVLAKLTSELAKRLVIGGFAISPIAKELANQLTNKTLSKYKVKFTTTERWAYERVFDIHEWIDAYMWKHVRTTFQIIRK